MDPRIEQVAQAVPAFSPALLQLVEDYDRTFSHHPLPSRGNSDRCAGCLVSPELDELLFTQELELSTAAHWLSGATNLLICAAAGMSIGCGLNYSSPEDFARQYPAMIQHGYDTGYSTMGMAQRKAPPQLRWGFLGLSSLPPLPRLARCVD